MSVPDSGRAALLVPVAGGASAGGTAAAAVKVDGVVAGEVAADGVDSTGAEHLCLMDSHCVQPGLLVSFLFHCYCPFLLLVKGVAALKILKKFISIIIRTHDGGVAFDNFLIQFSYNFERSDHGLHEFYLLYLT